MLKLLVKFVYAQLLIDFNQINRPELMKKNAGIELHKVDNKDQSTLSWDPHPHKIKLLHLKA